MRYTTLTGSVGYYILELKWKTLMFHGYNKLTEGLTFPL